jgi:hypothetical protein
VSQRIREKIALVKQTFSNNLVKEQRFNNADVIERALDFLIERDCSESNERVEIPRFDGNHVYFMCTDSAISQLLHSVKRHHDICHSRLEFRQDQILMCGTVASFQLSCSSGHSVSWSSSVYLPNGTFLANARWIHSCYSTGLLPGQISRFQDGLGFVAPTANHVRDLTAKYTEAVKITTGRVCDSALQEEIGLSFENGGAISILTDARHGGRRNAKDTNVVCIGHETHKVLKEQHVTKEDDECTQRHELLGTKKLYSFFDSAIPSLGGQ